MQKVKGTNNNNNRANFLIQPLPTGRKHTGCANKQRHKHMATPISADQVRIIIIIERKSYYVLHLPNILSRSNKYIRKHTGCANKQRKLHMETPVIAHQVECMRCHKRQTVTVESLHSSTRKLRRTNAT